MPNPTYGQSLNNTIPSSTSATSTTGTSSMGSTDQNRGQNAGQDQNRTQTQGQDQSRGQSQGMNNQNASKSNSAPSVDHSFFSDIAFMNSNAMEILEKGDLHELKEGLTNFASEIESRIKSHPIETLLMGVGMGMIWGKMFRNPSLNLPSLLAKGVGTYVMSEIVKKKPSESEIH